MNYKKISKVVSGVLLCTFVLYTTPIFAYTKDETVYSKIDSEGKEYKTIVSTHLNNTENENLIKDMTDLLNIKNTNGNEKFEQNENSIIWDAQKNDIYYQGDSQKELPIDVSIKYELNDTEIDSKDIVGKCGKVKITLTYTNKDEHIVDIKGKQEKLYTPFVVVAGSIIDNTNNKNITVSNGKVVDDGSKTFIMGMAFPGLQDSLNISKNKLDIPNSIEITMETTNFEMNSIINYVTPKIIEKDTLGIFDDIEKIYNQANNLSNSSKQIEDGVNTLNQGTQTYSEKIKEFKSALEKISQGMTSANLNYNKINDGIKLLNSNSYELNNGTKQINNGIGQIETNLKIINTKLGELAEGGKGIKQGETEIIKAIDSIILKLEQIPVPDTSNKIKELETLVKTNNETISSLENLNKTLKIQYDNSTDEKERTNIKLQMDSNTSIINLLQANNKAENETIKMLKLTDYSAIVELKSALKKVKTGLTSLSNGTDVLNTGILALQSGSNTLVEKTAELKNGSNKLYQETNKLLPAIESLKDGSNEMKKGLNILDNSGIQLLQANMKLTDASNSLNEGAKTLTEGISKFNSEGIKKICEFINGDVKDIMTRIEKLDDLSKKYNNFTLLSEGNNGDVKFIMITDDLKKQKEDN